MSGVRYVCEVLQPFGSVGPSGLVERKAGDEVVRLRAPADGSAHLKLLREEGGMGLVTAPATGEVMTPVEGDTLTTEPATAEGEAVEAQPQAAADAPAEAVTAAAPAPAVRRARAQPQAAA